MTHHPSSAVSVATSMIAITFAVIVILSVGYRTGRAHAAWRDLRSTQRDVPRKRHLAWSQSRSLVWGALFLVSVLFVAAWHAGH
jgi:hypothetical protein